MPSRSVTKALYTSDILLTQFVRRVDDHLYTQAQLGWVPDTGAHFNIPTGLKCRHAVGVDATGRTHRVVVADPSATLWTRSTLTWDILDDTGALVTVTLTGLVGESVSF